MKTFRGFRSTHHIAGNERDSYYNLLPDHDLGGLSNYFFRLASKVKCKTVIDVGANIGLSALLISEISPSAHVYAFEPTPEAYDTLVNNISQNLASAFVTPVRSALANRSGTINFSLNSDNSSGNHITTDNQGVAVDVTTLDKFVSAQGIEHIDFIKIDVEGHERSVVEGAADSIFRFRPVVMLEFNEYALRTNAGADPIATLAGLQSSLGQLGVVDGLTGEATALPNGGESAYQAIKAISKSDFDVFDLVTQRF